jgi:hypothetical protein
MHLIFGIRGIMHQTEMFKMFLQTQMWKWKRLNVATGKEEVIQVQGALREVMFGFYEYIFPEECVDEVLTCLEIDDKARAPWWFGVGNMKMFMLRRMIGNGIYKIPKYKRVTTNRYIEKRGIAIYPIGLKKDKRGMCPDGSPYFQEML